MSNKIIFAVISEFFFFFKSLLSRSWIFGLSGYWHDMDIFETKLIVLELLNLVIFFRISKNDNILAMITESTFKKFIDSKVKFVRL